MRDVDAYSATLTGVELGGEEKLPPLLFFENRKQCPDFGRKGTDCIQLWIKFPTQNVILRVSRRKISKMFPNGASFSCVFEEMFIKCPSSTYPSLLPCSENFLVGHLH